MSRCLLGVFSENIFGHYGDRDCLDDLSASSARKVRFGSDQEARPNERQSFSAFQMKSGRGTFRRGGNSNPHGARPVY